MKRILVKSALVALGALLFAVSTIWFLSQLFSFNISQTLVTVWTATWWLGLVFGIWNVIDGIIDLVNAHKGGALTRWAIPGAEWLLRSELFLTGACACMTLAGLSAITGIGTPEWRAMLILLGGIIIICDRAGSRLDRERIHHSSANDRGTPRATAREAIRLSRLLAHDVLNKINPAIVAIEDVQAQNNITEEERTSLTAALVDLQVLVQRVAALQARIHAIDHTYHRTT